MAEGTQDDRDPIARSIFTLLEERGPGKSICPSEAARHLQQARARPNDPADAWRRLLPAVRQQAIHLARKGNLRILRKGRPVDPQGPVKGVIRLALPEPAADGDLLTERLRLRGLDESDAPDLAAMNADPEVMRFIATPKPYHEALEQAKAFIAWNRENPQRFWAIEDRVRGGFHGWVFLATLEELDDVELGYRLPRASWGRGIATEASRRMVELAFADQGLPRLIAVTDPGHHRSQHVLDKLGFSFKGTRRAYGVDGLHYFVLERADWRRHLDVRAP